MFKVFNLIAILTVLINWSEYLFHLGLKVPVVIKYYLDHTLSSSAHILVNNRLEPYSCSARKACNRELSFSLIAAKSLWKVQEVLLKQHEKFLKLSWVAIIGL